MEGKLFEEIDRHLLEDKKPSEYLRSILYKIKKSNFSVITDLEEVEQNPAHHPEGNVLNHTLLVVDAAAIVREYAKDKRALMWAALFHDLGKKQATKLRKGKLVAYDHDNIGYNETNKLFDKIEFLNDNFKKAVANIVKYHMHHLYVSKELPFGDAEKMILDVEMHDMALMFFADKLGRGDFSKSEVQRVAAEVIDILDKLEVDYDIDLKAVRKDLLEVYNTY